jgi:hypothetical protein
MKKITLLITLASIITLSSCGPTVSQLISFNDELVDYEIDIVDALDVLYETFDTYQEDEMWSALDELHKAGKKCKSGISDVNIEGGQELKQSLMDLSDFIIHASKNELIEVVNNLLIPDEDYTDDDKAHYDLMADGFDAQSNLLIEAFIERQQEFGGRNNFDIEY